MILLHTEAKKLRNGNRNPKDYPYWNEVIEGLKDYNLVQIGIDGDKQYVPDFRKNLPFKELTKLIHECKTWIGIDSFFQHLCWYEGKTGIVLFGYSDPNIFGHIENINLYKSKELFRANQFGIWEEVTYSTEVFAPPAEVISAVEYLLK